MAVTGALDQIRLKIRRITGRPSSSQITNDEIDDYVNSFYAYDLPEHLRFLNLKEDYAITLEPGVDKYDFDLNSYVSIQPPAYVAGYQIQFFQDKQTFYEFYTQLQMPQILATGDGTTGPYSGSISATPIIPESVFISTVDSSGAALSCTDDGSGVLTGDATGTIDYETGAVAALAWSNTITASEDINVQSVQYAAARPTGVLLYENEFTFRPIPDKGYQFTITAHANPTVLINASDEPLIREWWELIAMGAALKIFADNMDMESYSKLDVLFDKHLRLAERRTLKQLSTQRANTIYSQYDQFPFSGQYPFA